MLIENGKEILRVFDDREHKSQEILEVTDGVWFARGVGHSNAIFVEADESLILIDTLDTLERGQKLRSAIEERCRKPVRTIIYTHGHPDHRGGAAAFEDTVSEIIAFSACKPQLAGMERLGGIQGLRARRQFGYGMSDEEAVSQGLGPREGMNYGEHKGSLDPTTVYDQELVVRTIDGVELELRRLPGETDDQIAVWIPKAKVLCCGDNYYGCFPNLYAIRGGQYRDIASWIESLGQLMDYPAEYLLPGHTGAISGQEHIREVLGNYRAMMQYILDETLRGMDAGKTADELAEEIRLPRELSELPYLGEHYGCVEWTVREIYAAYMGWFDGDPAKLHPMPVRERSSRMIELMGGEAKVLEAAEAAMDRGEAQLALELCSMAEQSLETDVLQAETFSQSELRKALELKARALRTLADMETSANGRHYYIACAKEIENRIV